MAESNGRPSPSGVDTPFTIFDPATKLYFQVFARDQNLYQSIYAHDASGKESFRHTERVAYSIGSGVNGIGYVIRKGDYLFQAPLAFYIRTRTWDLAPGYRGRDFGFTREISIQCITCHSGIPQPVLERKGAFKNPPFRELPIGCENCHGPGQLHVAARLKGEPISSAAIDRTIVNPAKLPVWLASNTCMYCHEEGDAQALKSGKSFLDIRPGVPLDDVVALLRIRPPQGAAPQSELLDRFGEMMSSKCYISSGGRLGCLTCHDPHNELPPEKAVAHYRSRCLSCHTEKSCKLPLQARYWGKAPNDCAGCHMLKAEVPLPHSSVTNHRIVAVQGEPLSDFFSSPTTSCREDLIHLDAIPGSENASLAPLTLFQAYRQLLLTTKNPKYVACYLRVLQQLEISQPDNPLVLSALARRSAQGGTPADMDEAIHWLKRALALGANDPSDFLSLGQLLVSRHRSAEAIAVIKDGLLLDPYYVPYYQFLAYAEISMGDFEHSREAVRQGLQQFPESRALQAILEKLGKGDGSP